MKMSHLLDPVQPQILLTAAVLLLQAATTMAQPAEPIITSQPTNQTVCSGFDATFTATATGAMPLSYQWYAVDISAIAISGATSSIYTVSSAQSSNAGYYRVVITNISGSATSSNVLLTVNPKPTSSAGPNKGICIGNSTDIGGSPTATGGTQPYSYTWSPATGLSS